MERKSEDRFCHIGDDLFTGVKVLWRYGRVGDIFFETFSKFHSGGHLSWPTYESSDSSSPLFNSGGSL